ncbi:MAG: hypothetical protein ACR2OC_00235 [Solirubrobacterales bacterium]
MDPDTRSALLAVGVVFCLAFTAMTVLVIAESGLDILTVTSLLIVGMVLSGLIGAYRNPPG